MDAGRPLFLRTAGLLMLNTPLSSTDKITYKHHNSAFNSVVHLYGAKAQAALIDPSHCAGIMPFYRNTVTRYCDY